MKDSARDTEDQRGLMGVVVETAGAADASLHSGESVVRRVGQREQIAGFFDKILEAGWLAAVVGLPLIFTPNMVMVFGVPKAAVLWSLAMAMAVVFLLKAAVVGASQTAPGGDASLQSTDMAPPDQ